jgi:hypothetical protein
VSGRALERCVGGNGRFKCAEYGFALEERCDFCRARAALRVTYRLDERLGHVLLRIWINGASAGVLTARLDERGPLDWIVESIRADGATEVEG